MNCALSLSISMGSSAANLAMNAVSPDLFSRHELRSKTSIRQNGEKILIEIDAKDSVALRASINSYLKSIILSEKIRRLFA